MKKGRIPSLAKLVPKSPKLVRTPQELGLRSLGLSLALARNALELAHQQHRIHPELLEKSCANIAKIPQLSNTPEEVAWIKSLPGAWSPLETAMFAHHWEALGGLLFLLKKTPWTKHEWIPFDPTSLFALTGIKPREPDTLDDFLKGCTETRTEFAREFNKARFWYWRAAVQPMLDLQMEPSRENWSEEVLTQVEEMPLLVSRLAQEAQQEGLVEEVKNGDVVVDGGKEFNALSEDRKEELLLSSQARWQALAWASGWNSEWLSLTSS